VEAEVSRRVVITGIGLVSSVGIGTEANWSALLRGCSGIATITRFDVSLFSTHIAGEVKGFDPLAFVDKKDVKKMDAFIQYAMAASEFAILDSGFAITPQEAARVGVFIASGIGGFGTIASTRRTWTAALAAFRRSSSPRPSSISPPARFRSAGGRRDPTPPRARPARPPRTPSATPGRSSGAMRLM
jgi:3-oxoacyl-(acyl-carrier-protein) synthase